MRRRRTAMCPKRRGQVCFPDADRAEDERAAGVVEEPQRAQLVPELPVVADRAVAGEGLEPHRRVELRGPGAQVSRGAVAAFDLVGEHQGQEVHVGQRLLRGQREPVGQGVEHRPSLTVRSRLFRSASMTGAGAGGVGVARAAPAQSAASPGRELAVVAGEAGRPADHLRRPPRPGRLGGLLEHAGDLARRRRRRAPARGRTRHRPPPARSCGSTRAAGRRSASLRSTAAGRPAAVSRRCRPRARRGSPWWSATRHVAQRVLRRAGPGSPSGRSSDRRACSADGS